MIAVSDTAFLVAAFRARESARPDALFVDPFAGRLAGERSAEMVEKLAQLGELAGWSTVVRTVLIDRLLGEAIARGTQTVVNLGAGLDARPYRMSLPPSVSWIEVDQPSIIAHKETVLAQDSPRCALRRFAIDLVDATARHDVLAQVSGDTRALVLAEGVFPYLQPDDVARILDDLHAHPAMHHLIVDYFSPELIRARTLTASLPIPFAPEDWQGFFAARGWRVEQMCDLVEEGERCGRPFPVKSHGRFAAYALMERSIF